MRRMVVGVMTGLLLAGCGENKGRYELKAVGELLFLLDRTTGCVWLSEPLATWGAWRASGSPAPPEPEKPRREGLTAEQKEQLQTKFPALVQWAEAHRVWEKEYAAWSEKDRIHRSGFQAVPVGGLHEGSIGGPVKGC